MGCFAMLSNRCIKEAQNKVCEGVRAVSSTNPQKWCQEWTICEGPYWTETQEKPRRVESKMDEYWDNKDECSGIKIQSKNSSE